MGGVKLLRFESIRSIRCESVRANSIRFGGSRFVCVYWGSNFVRFVSIRGLLCIRFLSVIHFVGTSFLKLCFFTSVVKRCVCGEMDQIVPVGKR